MERHIKIDIASINDFSNKIKDAADSIGLIVDKITLQTDEMSSFFDTPTGKKVKETMLILLKNIKAENEGLAEYGKKIVDANSVYASFIRSVSQSIGGSK